MTYLCLGGPNSRSLCKETTDLSIIGLFLCLFFFTLSLGYMEVSLLDAVPGVRMD
jgi:hypothetical protein